MHGTAEGDGNRSAARDAWAAELDPPTRELLSRDAAVFVHQQLSTPCMEVVEAAQGAWLHARGRSYLDFHGNGVHALGHGSREVIEAVARQAAVLSFAPRRFTTLPAIELAERLAERFPDGPGRCLLAPSGGVAVEIAVALAQAATGRRGVLAFWDAFHGAGPAAAGIGGEPGFRRHHGIPGAAIHVPPPATFRDPVTGGPADPWRTAAEIAYVLERHGDIACLVAEPLRSTTVEIPPDGFWTRVREACDRAGVLIVADEVPLGLGRTGTFLASEAVGLRPDAVVLGKSLGGGVMPLAAVLARPGLAPPPGSSVGHVTHEKSPVGAAAGLATLAAVDRLDLPGEAARKGRWFGDALRTLGEREPAIGDVRGTGLMWAVELVDPRDGRSPDAALAERVLYGSLRRGLSFKVSSGNILTLAPPLTIEREELRLAVAVLEESLLAARRRTPGAAGRT
jgi:4-aminobutyrate aminotransferase